MDNEKYTFKVERPEEIKDYHPEQKRKRRFAIFVAAMILCGCVVSGGLGGTVGYYIAKNAATEVSDDSGNDNSDASLDNLGGDVSPSPNPSDYTVTSSTNKDREKMSFADIYDLCNPAVVAISTQLSIQNAFGQMSSAASAGSGFIISADGLIVTNYHVIEDATSIEIMLYDGKKYSATVVGKDSTSDLALLKIDASNLSYLKFGDSSAMRVGEFVAAIGNPLGELANTQTVGTISALSREINIDGTPMVMLQTDASISPGNSGGPLINEYGEVIGVVSAKSVSSGVEGIGFAIPSNIAVSVINDLKNYGYVSGRPYAGISLQTIDSRMARYYNIPVGAYVTTVESGSAADKAGLKTADVITAMEGEAVTSDTDFITLKSKYSAGDTVTLTVTREGKEISIRLIFDEAKGR